jgi:hypothetical protein
MYTPICCIYKTNIASSLQNPMTCNTRGLSRVRLQVPTIDKLVGSLILRKNQWHTVNFFMSVVYPKPMTGANWALSRPFSRALEDPRTNFQQHIFISSVIVRCCGDQIVTYPWRIFLGPSCIPVIGDYLSFFATSDNATISLFWISETPLCTRLGNQHHV